MARDDGRGGGRGSNSGGSRSGTSSQVRPNRDTSSFWSGSTGRSGVQLPASKINTITSPRTSPTGSVPRTSVTIPTGASSTAGSSLPGRPGTPSISTRSGGNPYAAAMAAQAAAAAAARRRAGARFQSMAGNLDPQIEALRLALEEEFKRNLDQNLEDVGLLIREQTSMLKSQAAARAADFLSAADRNEKALAGQTESSLENFVRERQDTLSAVLTQGAGQTDALRALVGAARGFRSNVQEGARAYFDSLQSINQSITDLNLDTQTALANVHSQGESERERLWTDYYNRRSEAFTQLGNLYQQQADYLDMAEEQTVGGGGGGKKSKSGEVFKSAATELGKSYKKEALPDWIADYEGQEQVEGRLSSTDLAARVRYQPLGSAEGATTARGRRWR